MSASQAYNQFNPPTRQLTGIGFVVLLHALLIWGLIFGLGHRLIDVVPAPLQAVIIPAKQAPKQVAPPPPPPSVVTPPPPDNPPPLGSQSPAARANAITAAPAPVAPAPVAVAAPPPPVAAIPDRDVSEVPIGGAAPTYPRAMQLQDREGWASVACTVDVTGVTSDCAVLESHGSDEFGASALDYARSQRYRPAIHNGQPVTKRKIWRLNFTLG